MKNLKFRAWDKELKMMCDVLKIDFKNKTLFYHHWAHGVSTEIDLNEVELMQSTGLKDINGTEIYEGDILKTSIKNLVVEWVPKGACWGIGCHYLFHYYETSEVIGNKYQNPELLEG